MLVGLFCGLAACTSSRNIAGQWPVERLPNIVIILADDLGYGDLSAYGGWIETPHLDRLAATGMRFTDFHSSGPVCSPTRAALLTGRYPQRAGLPGVIFADHARNRHHGLHPHEPTFAHLLQRAGYATAIFGKWYLGYEPRYNPIHHGFDEFRGFVSGNVDYRSHVDGVGVADWWNGRDRIEEEGYTTHLITKHAVRFIEDNRDRPFCLYIAHEAPHFPYQGPHDEADRYVTGGTQAWDPLGSRPDRRNAYREMVHEMDKGVGEVLAALTRHALESHTLVFFFSDNGALPPGSNAPLRGDKGTLWEGAHRVPAIAWWPGRIDAGAASDELATGMDLLPTLLALAGVQPPSDRPADGVSLLPVLLGREPLPPRPLFWAHGDQAVVREGPWKLLVNPSGERGVQLYNLADDLAEQHDVAAAHPQRIQRLRALLEQWRRDVEAGATQQPEDSAQDGVQ
ncbi:MAG: sulfatase-like hydrolase/transferase [Luteitalea sp.]|nr:sulfatase-like hydrolase/transferase [Luteitalea sp.]